MNLSTALQKAYTNFSFGGEIRFDLFTTDNGCSVGLNKPLPQRVQTQSPELVVT